MERTTAGAQSPRATVHALRSARGSPQRVIRDSTDFCDLWRKYHSLRAPIALRSICQFEIASVSWQRNGIFPPGAHGPQDIPGALFFPSTNFFSLSGAARATAVASAAFARSTA